MTTRYHLLAFGPACTALLGCAATPMELTGGFSHVDSRELVYDELVLDIVDPSAAATLDVAVKTSGDGAKDGLKMMVQAPVGCLQAGPMVAVFCVGMAPLFPFLAAGGVQDVETSRTELDSMARRIDEAGIQQRFRESIEAQARQAQLPLVESPSPGARVATLHAELGQIRLEHGGYDHSDISLTQPYRFSLSYGDHEAETLVEGERFAQFDPKNWSYETTAELDRTVERWARETATLGLRDSVIEWQPKVVLGPVAPTLMDRRNIIGIKQHRWPFVESTTPRLAWQPLEAVLDPSILADVTDISYEIEIGRRGINFRASGLTIPEYVVPEPLSPCSYYSWRPLARFRYRGVMHTTSPNMRRWSKTEFVEDDFKFKTPAADCKDPA